MTKKHEAPGVPPPAPERKLRKPRPFPWHTLEQSVKLAHAIEEFNAGRPYSRLSLAESLGRSPESSSFRTLIVAASAYGLTSGSYKATHISLTDLGASAVSPRNPEEQTQALLEAARRIPLFNELYNHFDQRKIPPMANFRSTLVRDYGVEPEIAEACASHFVADGRFAGLIRNLAGADRVSVHDALPYASVRPIEPLGTEEDSERLQIREDVDEPAVQLLGSYSLRQPPVSSNNRVFITHGKNKKIVEQLKQILTFGKFAPIVAEDHETLAKPVPDKVFEEMESCSAAIIHVATEEILLDRSGNERPKINDNVLIEIGAARMRYKGNFILLVERGTPLPSNLQGLYRCEYEGEQLDLDAAMKLLRTFNEFNLA
jgi:predicted nucleotide-binding protein